MNWLISALGAGVIVTLILLDATVTRRYSRRLAALGIRGEGGRLSEQARMQLLIAEARDAQAQVRSERSATSASRRRRND